MDTLKAAANEVAARLRDLDRTIEERRDEEVTVLNLLISTVAPALPAISVRTEFPGGAYLDGVVLAGAEIIDCAGLRSGWALILAKDGLLGFLAYGPGEDDVRLAYASPREALESGAITAEGVAETLAGLLDAHLHGRSEVRRREYAEILGRMRAASAALRGEQ